MSLYSWKSIKPRLRLFKWYPEKQLICQDVKCLSERETGKTKVPRLDYLRSQDRNLHIPPIYCDTFLPTNSKSRPFRSEGADVSHTHTKNPLNRTLRLWGFRLCASTWCAMIVNDRKTHFTTLEYFATDAFSSSTGRRHCPATSQKCIFFLWDQGNVFSVLCFSFPVVVFFPHRSSSDILSANIISWTNSWRFGSGKLDYGSSRAAQTPCLHHHHHHHHLHSMLKVLGGPVGYWCCTRLEQNTHILNSTKKSSVLNAGVTYDK